MLQDYSLQQHDPSLMGNSDSDRYLNLSEEVARKDEPLESTKSYEQVYEDILAALLRNVRLKREGKEPSRSVYEEVAESLVSLTLFAACVVRLIFGDGNELTVVDKAIKPELSWTLREDITRKPGDRSIPTRAGELGAEYVVADIQGQKLTDVEIQNATWIEGQGFRAIICLPLIIRDNFVGTVSLFAEKTQAFTFKEVSFLRQVASLLAFFKEISEVRKDVRQAFDDRKDHTERKDHLLILLSYLDHAEERVFSKRVPPLPLSEKQAHAVCDLLLEPIQGVENYLLHLLSDRIPPGVDQASYVKATFLTAVARGKKNSPLISKVQAVELLGTMLGGYNVQVLVDLLKDNDVELATSAAEALKKTLLVYDAFNDVFALAQNGNKYAQHVVSSWAAAEWFTNKPKVPDTIDITVFKVPGETNTDDLSPAPHATSRPDIPLHGLVMLESRMPEALDTIAELKTKGNPVAYVGDVVGTGSSRKSAMNSVIWHLGEDIPHVPNKRTGGYILGGKIAPIFFNTAEDSGALPIECDVSHMEMGDVITIHVRKGEITKDGKVISTFSLTPDTILDEVRAGGRIPLMIGRALTDKTRAALGLEPSDVFVRPAPPADTGKGYTLAQKMVGKACGLSGVRPGMSCEPLMTTVGSQDTTGPMTRDEMKELACLGFSAGLVLQTFCHTAAYPKPVDVETHATLPDFFASRGGVALQPGDGIIHSWLNRMLLPDTVGTGGDSHTRFPLGISFPAGSGLVAFAAAIGAMPLDMPESVLVKFKGELQPGITLRDIVNAIPYVAIQNGLLTVEKKNKKNVFSGRIIEMEGLPDLKLEQAFELTDATAERSAAGCTIKLSEETVAEYLRSNVALMKNMIARGYSDARTLARRIAAMEDWLANPSLMSADSDAEYAEVIEIDLNEIKEPLVAAPNDPDNIKTLSEVVDDRVDEVFIGSCMTNIGHYRASAKVLEGAGTVKGRLWICPPTRMDEQQLRKEGYYGTFAAAGARTEMPGCSLCMGNQARVEDGATVFSTSTRNFNNRMGKGAQVYLGSAELAAACALLGRIPSMDEYLEIVAKKIDPFADDLYRYLNFDQLKGFEDEGRVISKEEEEKIEQEEKEVLSAG